MRKQFGNLQALRGVACLMVVLLHLWDLEIAFGQQTLVLKEIRWFGFAGVDLFFVLSGFLITATNVRRLGRPGSLFCRFWRIFPPLLGGVRGTVIRFPGRDCGVCQVGILRSPLPVSGDVAIWRPDNHNQFLGGVLLVLWVFGICFAVSLFPIG